MGGTIVFYGSYNNLDERRGANLSRSPEATSRAGLAYAVAAYGLWGGMPLYFRAIARVPPVELLVHRIVWSVAFLAALLTLLRGWPAVVACWRDRRTLRLLACSTVLIATNWFLFIYGVATGQVVQNSLGYFINPLLNIVLGVVLFHERLRAAQWLGLGLATGGLVYLMAAQGEVPWIALLLAASFAAYGVIRKVAPVDALAGLMVETTFLLPVGLLFLGVWAARGELSLAVHGWHIDALLYASGAVTAVPLLCFGAAARRLPLSTLGFVQYLAPTLQFLLAVLHLGEPFRPAQQVSFGLIWLALAVVTVDGLWARRGASKAELSPGETAPLESGR